MDPRLVLIEQHQEEKTGDNDQVDPKKELTPWRRPARRIVWGQPKVSLGDRATVVAVTMTIPASPPTIDTMILDEARKQYRNCKYRKDPIPNLSSVRDRPGEQHHPGYEECEGQQGVDYQALVEAQIRTLARTYPVDRVELRVMVSVYRSWARPEHDVWRFCPNSRDSYFTLVAHGFRITFWDQIDRPLAIGSYHSRRVKGHHVA